MRHDPILPRLAVGGLLVAGLLAACGPQSDGGVIGQPTSDPTATSTRAPAPTLGAECEDPEVGYRTSYPSDWRTNDGEVVPTCRLFDPQPIEVEPQTEIPFDIAVAVRTTDVSLETFATEDMAAEVLTSRSTTVDGHEAVVVEVRSTGEAMLPEGVHSYRYAVDLGDRRLVAATHDVGEPAYEQTRQVLDQMMDTIDLP